MNWFSSDFHLGHTNLHKKGYRKNIFSSIEEHDEVIIENIFSVIKPGDNFYFLGDLFFKYSTEEKITFFNRFKKNRVNFHWILGNHDKPIRHKAIVFIGHIKDIKIGKQRITLCHYPMIVWNNSHLGAWQLFGHIHKNDNTDLIFPYERLGKQLNVNVDFWDFKPVSFEEIEEIMKKKKENFDILHKT